MKLLLKCIFFTALLFFFQSCRNSADENPRAYVEGKINPATVEKFTLKIVSQDKTMAETTIKSDGSFVLSGPIFPGSFTVVSSHKIESFQTLQTELSISSDRYQIIVPQGVTYLKFNEIKVIP